MSDRFSCVFYAEYCLGFHVVTEGIDPVFGLCGTIVCCFVGDSKADMLVTREAAVSNLFLVGGWGGFFALLKISRKEGGRVKFLGWI